MALKFSVCSAKGTVNEMEKTNPQTSSKDTCKNTSLFKYWYQKLFKFETQQ